MNVENREKFIAAAKEFLGGADVISRKQIREVCNKYGLPRPRWLLLEDGYRVARGQYKLTMTPAAAVAPVAAPAQIVEVEQVVLPQVMDPVASGENFVPTRMKGYVPFGNYDTLYEIVKSRLFFTAYITGLSGNGKTLMVEQIAAKLGRELIRANITAETDEDDLLGGFRLVNGETVWNDGPVVTAMKRGAILLLDEVDLGTPKLMCLQPVLEGRSVFLKKINKRIEPAEGFNIIATANTKGRGSDDGRFIGTMVMNEAFLERFSITIEQEYPSAKEEVKILEGEARRLNLDVKDEKLKKFITNLVDWAGLIRKSFYEGAVTDIIATRRLVMIMQSFAIFKDEMKSIKLTLNRFDDETKRSFIDVWDKMTDETPVPEAAANDPTDKQVDYTF